MGPKSKGSSSSSAPQSSKSGGLQKQYRGGAYAEFPHAHSGQQQHANTRGSNYYHQPTGQHHQYYTSEAASLANKMGGLRLKDLPTLPKTKVRWSYSRRTYVMSTRSGKSREVDKYKMVDRDLLVTIDGIKYLAIVED
ncbi:MAG: hypothetical protein Q9211_001815 [Gyalolechia sp. 1 TL-2023]